MRVVVLVVAAWLVLGACGGGTKSSERSATGRGKATTSDPTTMPSSSTTTTPALPPLVAARPGVARVIGRGRPSDGVVLSFDDGYCDSCVANLVDAVERTGAHVTFCPNGSYGTIWGRYADRIKRLITRRQVSICNHGFNHKNLTRLSSADIGVEIQRNEDWIEQTFGVTSRPFFRPPGGAYNAQVLAVAGGLGFTEVVNWSATLSDSALQPESHLTDVVQRCAEPGVIFLGHANYPPTGQVFDSLVRIIGSKQLRTVTMDELLGDGAEASPPSRVGACV